MEEAARELLAHFNHRNLDSLLKVTRNTLEQLRKRITTSSLVHYISGELLFTPYNMKYRLLKKSLAEASELKYQKHFMKDFAFSSANMVCCYIGH